MRMPVLIRAEAVPAQPWRNGGGRTRELLTRPVGARSWLLRISVAEVDREGPFSVFAGVRRWFAVLDGAGVRLSLDGQERTLDAGHEPIDFSGEAPASCRLVDGATRDLNLMHASGIGLMRAAPAAEPWRCEAAHRGIFTRVAGLWQAEGTEPIELPAFSLLWMDDAGPQAWCFRPDAPTAAAPALWLAWDP